MKWRATCNSEREAQRRFPGEWIAVQTGLMAVGRYKGHIALFVHPVDHPEEARWIPAEAAIPND